VLDGGGEYHRLGDAKRRTSSVRLIAATNRPPSHLKHDLLARLPLRIEVPGLNDRREDVPLLVRHVLRRAAARDREVDATFFDHDGPTPEPRVALAFVEALVRHSYATHARELEAFVWRSLATSKRGVVELTSALAEELGKSERPLMASRPPTEVGEAEIRASLERNAGVRDRVWRELGLSSRHALTRLMKRYGLDRDD
jgi:two-component system nitrogen regulation response regulator GlnG/two-component system response regulator HydG